MIGHNSVTATHRSGHEARKVRFVGKLAKVVLLLCAGVLVHRKDVYRGGQQECDTMTDIS